MHKKISWRVALLIIVASTAVVGAWSHGTFDNFLWRVHLNAHDCAQNAFGATFCGHDLDSYENRLRDAGINP